MTVSCGIAPLRLNVEEVEVLLCTPINEGSYGLGFLKGQVEMGESNLETATREFAEESGNLDVKIIDESVYFTQDNPNKNIFIWPAIVLDSEKNKNKIDAYGTVHGHDEENEKIDFHPLSDLPMIFKNQLDITEELIPYFNENKDKLFPKI